MNNELEKMWKEVVMAYFKILSEHLPEGTEENHVKPQSGYLVPGPRFDNNALYLFFLRHDSINKFIRILCRDCVCQHIISSKLLNRFS
jgi:hypothetical protein